MANANLVVKWLISFTKLCQSGLVFIMHSPENSYFMMAMWNYNTNMYRKCECVVKHKSLCTSFTFQIVNYRTQGIHTHTKKITLLAQCLQQARKREELQLTCNSGDCCW